MSIARDSVSLPRNTGASGTGDRGPSCRWADLAAATASTVGFVRALDDTPSAAPADGDTGATAADVSSAGAGDLAAAGGDAAADGGAAAPSAGSSTAAGVVAAVWADTTAAGAGAASAASAVGGEGGAAAAAVGAGALVATGDALAGGGATGPRRSGDVAVVPALLTGVLGADCTCDGAGRASNARANTPSPDRSCGAVGMGDLGALERIAGVCDGGAITRGSAGAAWDEAGAGAARDEAGAGAAGA